MITIRPYGQTDHSYVIHLMTELQEHIASIDPFYRIRTLTDFDARAYVDQLLSRLQCENGSLLVADEDGILVGFIAGSIPKETEEDLIDHYPAREGKIYELVVSERHREKGVGRLLVEKIEVQFRSQGCEYVRVGCFAPNEGAHRFYEKYGYADRYTEMLKRL